MPSGTRSLFLQIGGNVDNLATAAKAGKSILAQFGADASGQIQQIEQAFQKLGGGGNIEASARALQATFTRSLSEIKRNAQQVLAAPSGNAAFGIINAQGAEAAADAASRQAASLRIVADAAEQAAVAQGTDNAALTAYAVAARAAALGSEEQAVALREQAATLRLVTAQLGEEADASDEAAAGHNRVGASGLIADHVVRSFTDSVVAGQSPLRALALELPRVGEALQLMSLGAEEGEGKFAAFASFLGGPWGIAITVALSAASALASSLLDGADAAKADTKAQDDLKAALDRLAGAEADLNHQTLQGIKNDIAAAAAARQHAIEARGLLQAQLELARHNAEGYDASGQFSGSAPGTVSGAAGVLAANERSRAADLDKQLNANQANITDLNKKILDGATKIIQRQIEGATDPRSAITQRFQDRADTLDRQFQSGKLTPEQYRTQYTAATKQRDSATEALKPARTRRPRADHTVERAANADRSYQNELNQAQQAYANALLGLSDTAQQRYKVEVDQLQSSLAQRLLEIADQVKAKKISETQADKLKALATETEALQEQAALRKEQSALLDQSYEKDKQAVDAQIELLRTNADLATTRKARLAIEQQILADQQQERRAGFQKVLNDPSASAADKALAQASLNTLPSQDSAEQRQLAQRYQSPLDAYRKQLSGTSLSDSLQGAQVDGLKGLEDGLTGIVSGTETVQGAFKKMASSIISDLARIAVEQAIIKPLANSLFGGGSGGGLFGSLGGLFGGGDQFAGTNSIISGTLSAFGGGKAVGGGVNDNEFYLVGENGPELFAPGKSGTIIPNHNLPQMSDLSPSDMRGLGGGAQRVQVEIGATPGEMFAPYVQNVSGATVQSAAPRIAAGGASLAYSESVRRAARRIPG